MTTQVSATSAFTFTPSDVFADGTAMTAAQIAALTFTILIDTVNPPGPTAKSYPVPAANVAAISGGKITVKFTDIGFVPATNVNYYADCIETEGVLASPSSGILSFINAQPPAAPSGFTVA